MQSSISGPSMVPSAAPRLKAIPALVVAIAANPACSRIRAEPASHAFGRMKPAPGRCIARNFTARFGVAEALMRPILRLGGRLKSAHETRRLVTLGLEARHDGRVSRLGHRRRSAQDPEVVPARVTDDR